MNPEFAYFLKVNAAFALFYAFYRLCFYKDTFFKMRRAILLAFYALAFIYPLLNIQEWMREQEPIVEMVYVYANIIMPEIVVEPTEVVTVSWTQLARAGLFFLYSGILLLLVVRFFVRLGSILWLAKKSRRMLVQGIPVHALSESSGPFSFFRLIFLHPGSHSEKETEEILLHERTHVSQWHSVDVMISELICICNWFNPFVWLLKREVRHNLEYLADNRVIQSGYDSRNYQYHLLGLAHHHPEESGLYNSFNVLHIKNRIRMMNKKRSHGIGRAKYLVLVPLVVMLMMLNNIGALAKIIEKLPVKTMEEVVTETIDLLPETVAHLSPTVKTESRPVASEPERIRTEVLDSPSPINAPTPPPPPTVDEEEVTHLFSLSEVMPTFPGGDEALRSYFKKSIRYPEDAQRYNEQGTVNVSFIISQDGSVRDAEIINGKSESLNREAIRVVSTMPKWNPGLQRGRAVAVRHALPVTFRLQHTPTEEEDAEDNLVFSIVEQGPTFPGGEQALIDFLNRSIQYPAIAQEKGIQGRVQVSFIVNSDGSISDAEILRGRDLALDTEAVRIINSMPKWNPGLQRGKPVRVKFSVPVTFKLQ